MPDKFNNEGQYGGVNPSPTPPETPGDPCANIEGSVRRGLCKVCQTPVVGEAPFCKDHEAPVP
ncbi:MAG: hypothetical protein AB7V04_05555 [Desulfomonilaceae bacterium]